MNSFYVIKVLQNNHQHLVHQDIQGHRVHLELQDYQVYQELHRATIQVKFINTLFLR